MPCCKNNQNLNWDQHIEMISKKIASGISAMKLVRNFTSLENLLTIYYALPEFLEFTEPR